MPIPARRKAIAVLLAAIALVAGGNTAAALSRAQFPIQSMGDRGIDVIALQHLLRARGRATPVNGFFGSDTRAALTSWQTSVGQGGNGVANVSTWERLVPELRQGDSGEAVLALKKELNAKYGAGLYSSSIFDGPTRNAVQSFQRHVGLPAGGVVDRNTWRNLVWHFMRPEFSRASLCNYNGGSNRADWGTGSTIAHLQAAADLFRGRAGGVVAIGDISFEHGGEINLHATHEHGLDIDIALIRTDGRQCSNPGISYRGSRYDRADTRQLLRAIHDTLGGHLKLIYFNDPQMIREGLSRRHANHDDHIHVRLCEPGHAKSIYRC